MKPLLSTSNSKIYSRRILAFILALAALYATAYAAVPILTKKFDDRNASQKLSMYQINDFYKLPNNSLDVLILGSSHAMCTYDPIRISNTFHLSTYNLGTALQQPDTAYYLLREVLKTQKPKVLIYDVYFKVMQNERAADQTTTVLKELRPSANALQMYINNLNMEDRIIFYNNWLNPFGRFQSVLQNATQATTTERSSFYRGNGFFITNNTVKPEALLPDAHPFPTEYQPLHPRQIEYLKKLVALAHENDIKILFFSAPMPPTIRGRIHYYNKLYEDISTIATELKIPYCDFNLEKSLLLVDTDFADQGHLNVTGDKKFMDYFISYAKDRKLF